MHTLHIDGFPYASTTSGGSLVGGDDPFSWGSIETSGSGQTEWDYIRVLNRIIPIREEITAVPEPSTLSLLGLAGLVLLRRRK